MSDNVKETKHSAEIKNAENTQTKEEKILKLVELGRQKGTLTYKEIGDALEDIDLKSEQCEALYEQLEALNIEIIDDEISIEDVEEEPEIDLRELTQNIKETDEAIKEGNKALLGMLKELSFNNDDTKAAVDEFIRVLEEV